LESNPANELFSQNIFVVEANTNAHNEEELDDATLHSVIFWNIFLTLPYPSLSKGMGRHTLFTSQ
jgi:hypothetical protein